MVEVAVIAPGAMGAGVARLLGERGASVCTWLEGRGAASVARAAEAGMRAVDLAGIAKADIVLSIVPPAEAMKLAQLLAPVLAGAAKPPVYVDCNAVSPQTVLQIEAAAETEEVALFLELPRLHAAAAAVTPWSGVSAHG